MVVFGKQAHWFTWQFKSKCRESCSVMSDSLQPHGLYSPWNSLGQNTGMGSLSLLQGIFPTQGSNPGLPHCRKILYHWATREAQEYWSGEPIFSLVDLPDPGIEPGSPALQVDFLPAELPGKPEILTWNKSGLCIMGQTPNILICRLKESKDVGVSWGPFSLAPKGCFHHGSASASHLFCPNGVFHVITLFDVQLENRITMSLSKL